MPGTETRSMSLYTATCLVVANMVGTGVFTSVGFQIAAGLSPFTILLLWLVGGICAFCGGVAYSELAAALPRSGGEYHFLSRIFHPAIGFLAGWTSVTAGFAAPVALAAMAFGEYVQGVFPSIGVGYSAAMAVAVITAIMVWSPKARTWFQDTATSLKVLLLCVLIVAGWSAASHGSSLAPLPGDLSQIITPDFAVSLAWVMYAYFGWNASVYVTSQVANPTRNVPLSMAIGTVIVTILYVLVNGAFLRMAPAETMANQPEAGLIAARYAFGETGGILVGLLISLGLLSHLGAMQWVGPHVLATMGEDHAPLKPFAQLNHHRLPMVATLTQTGIVLALLLTSTFKSVLNYVLFTLTLCSFLTVLGVFLLRLKEPNLPRPVRAWGYPVTPLIYLIVMGWMLMHVLNRQPRESAWGFATLLAGLIIYQLSERRLR